MRPEDVLSRTELRGLRHRSGLSQVNFARLLGIASNTLARMERGELAIRPTLGRLALYLVAEMIGEGPVRLRQELEAQRAAKKPKTTSKTTTRPKAARRRASTRRRT
jgi:transcriptional regulator with XRE-family HTH domain